MTGRLVYRTSTFRERLACGLFGHEWVRHGAFLMRYENRVTETLPVRRCARCHVGHPENPETTTFGGAS